MTTQHDSSLAECASQSVRPPARRFVVVVNPDAGSTHKRLVVKVVERLRALGADVTLKAASQPDAIFTIASASNADAILIAGGDGSINQAVRGLSSRAKPRPALGIIPVGTVNVLSQDIGLSRSADALARSFVKGVTTPLHFGEANGRPFVLMASAGVDAEIVRSVDLNLKKKIGRVAYLYSALRTLWRSDFPTIEAVAEGAVVSAKCVVVANSKYYGGRFVVDRDAGALRPGLTLIAVRDLSLASLLALVIYLATGRVDREGRLTKLPLERVTLRAKKVATQIDGDFLGETPLEICAGADPVDLLR
jgi:diacylglycerol kinase (ATP)